MSRAKTDDDISSLDDVASCESLSFHESPANDRRRTKEIRRRTNEFENGQRKREPTVIECNILPIQNDAKVADLDVHT